MRSGNPALGSNAFSGVSAAGGATMTADGAVNKSFLLLLLVVGPAAFIWQKFFTGTMPVGMIYTIAGGAAGLGLLVAIVTIFKHSWSPVLAPVYALLEGLVLGAVSAFAEARYPGIAVQAIGITFGVLLTMLLAYKSGVIKATERFKMGVVAATGAIALIYIATFILRFFHIEIPFIHGSGLIGIGFSVFVVVIASLNLVLDFAFIEEGAAEGAPKYMEWYAAFGLMVTLIWLYLEILRLLMKLKDRVS